MRKRQFNCRKRQNSNIMSYLIKTRPVLESVILIKKKFFEVIPRSPLYVNRGEYIYQSLDCRYQHRLISRV